MQAIINDKLLSISEKLRLLTSEPRYLEYVSALLFIADEDSNYTLKTDNNYKSMLSTIYNYRKDYNFGSILNDLLRDVKAKYYPKYIDAFEDINFNSLSLNKDVILDEFIEEFINLYSDINYSKKALAKAYENLLLKTQNLEIGNTQFYTPNEIVKVITQGLEKKEATICDPICGTGEFLIGVAEYFNKHKTALYGMEKNKTKYNLCITNLKLNDIKDAKIELGDFNAEWTLKENYHNLNFDYIICNPPFSSKTTPLHSLNSNTKSLRNEKSGNYAFVLNMLEHLKIDGQMTIVFPHGALFKNQEKWVREYLINNNLIDAIIGLPSNLFQGTRLAVILLVIKKNRSDKTKILFIDASREFEKTRKNNLLTKENIDKIIETYNKFDTVYNYSNTVSFEEILKNDFDLSINKYIKIIEEKQNFDKKKTVKNIEQLEKDIKSLDKDLKKFVEIITTN